MTNESDIALLESYLTDDLDPAEVIAVSERIRDEPEFAAALIRLTIDEAVLSDWAASQDAVRPVVDTAGRKQRRKWLTPAIVACGLVAFVIGGWWLVSRMRTADGDTRRAEVATITEVRGNVRIVSRDGQQRDATQSETIRSTDRLVTVGDSIATVRLTGGSNVSIGAKSKAEFVDDRIVLHHGRLFAISEAGDRNRLTVQTPHADIRPVGTRFRATVENDSTRVDVHEGRVRMTRRSDDRVVHCDRDHFVIVKPHEKMIARRFPHRRRTVVLLSPTADAYVTGTHPDKSFGGEKSLLVGHRHSAFLKFTILNDRRLLRAELLLHATHGGKSLTVFLAKHSDWNEQTVTAQHHPPVDRHAISRVADIKTGSHVVVDLKHAVRPHGTYTLFLRSDDRHPLRFASREAKTGGPILRLTFEPPPHDRPTDHLPLEKDR